MKERLIDRVRTYCYQRNTNVSEFERKSGLSNGYFQNLERDTPGASKLRGIAEAFPELSLSWLLTGYGPMTLNPDPVVAMLKEKDEQINRLLVIIENLSKTQKQ